MYFTKSVLEQLRITLDKKFFWGLIVIKKCDFLKLFLHLNSEVWDAIWVWIHSNVEGIHTSFAWIHSTCEGIQTETGIPLLQLELETDSENFDIKSKGLKWKIITKSDENRFIFYFIWVKLQGKLKENDLDRTFISKYLY